VAGQWLSYQGLAHLPGGGCSNIVVLPCNRNPKIKPTTMYMQFPELKGSLPIHVAEISPENNVMKDILRKVN